MSIESSVSSVLKYYYNVITFLLRMWRCHLCHKKLTWSWESSISIIAVPQMRHLSKKPWMKRGQYLFLTKTAWPLLLSNESIAMTKKWLKLERKSSINCRFESLVGRFLYHHCIERLRIEKEISVSDRDNSDFRLIAMRTRSLSTLETKDFNWSPGSFRCQMFIKLSEVSHDVRLSSNLKKNPRFLQILLHSTASNFPTLCDCFERVLITL